MTPLTPTYAPTTWMFWESPALAVQDIWQEGGAEGRQIT
jgi:hypothetical protein